MEEACIPCLIAGQISCRVPLVGDARQPGAKLFSKALEIIRLKQGAQASALLKGYPILCVEIGKQSPVQAKPYL